MGPYGGDARSLVADPTDFSHLYLGTTNSQVYSSTDGGRSWFWLSEIAPRPDLVVTRLVVRSHDPHTLLAAVWAQTETNGGVYRSTDSGRTWKPFEHMLGQSVRALAVAPSNPDILVAGTLESVFRSTNGGRSWDRISPKEHPEIRNVESIAIDPKDPNIIYAGTWHLPWKTMDGGKQWFSIKNGIIDDSDVFAIAIDATSPDTVYAGACSGIYRTDSAGEEWKKIQGIPSSARRTRALRQDPMAPPTVYAGTTEGLWMTHNGGANWQLLTSPNLIVNEAVINPVNPNHVILATDRAGIQKTLDGGITFTSTNLGFSHRQVWQLKAAGTLLAAAVLHDKDYGGIFFSDNGNIWTRVSAGLSDQDVLALVHSQGDWLAGTNTGLFRLNGSVWERTGEMERSAAKPAPPTKGSKEAKGAKERVMATSLSTQIDDLVQDGEVLYAATKDGLLRSSDNGRMWKLVSPNRRVDRVAASGKTLLAATGDGLLVSTDGGANWRIETLPESPVVVHSLLLAGRTIYAATGHGLLRSPDLGFTWEKHGRGIPLGPVYDVAIDPANAQNIYVASSVGNAVYLSKDGGASYEALPRTGYHSPPRRLTFGPGGKLYSASTNDGVFLLVP